MPAYLHHSRPNASATVELASPGQGGVPLGMTRSGTGALRCGLGFLHSSNDGHDRHAHRDAESHLRQITLCLPSTTAESISHAPVDRAGVHHDGIGLGQLQLFLREAKAFEVPWLEGSSAPLMRSFCRRSMILTTSASLMPSSSVGTRARPSAPCRPAPAVRGPTTTHFGRAEVVRACGCPSAPRGSAARRPRWPR